jgi:hypothetical protein
VTGFTGVVWQARPAQQLAADLVDGAGPTATADAALAWGHVAVMIADAGLDYAAILTRLGIGWESATSDQAFGRLRAFASWFADASAAAAENGGRTTAQCAATTVARLNMPNLPEIALTEGIRDTAAAVGAALGAPIGGVAADAERALHDQKQRAARVMDAYESASEPLASPWFPPRPMQVVSEKALAAEHTAGTEVQTSPLQTFPLPTAPGPAVSSLTGGFAPTPVAAEREKTRFAATVLAGSTAPAPATGTGQPAPSRTPGSIPAVPPVAAPLATTSAQPTRSAIPNAGVDASGSAADDNHRVDDEHGVAGDHPIDARYRTGVLDLPAATSVPAVIGAADGNR